LDDGQSGGALELENANHRQEIISKGNEEEPKGKSAKDWPPDIWVWSTGGAG